MLPILTMLPMAVINTMNITCGWNVWMFLSARTGLMTRLMTKVTIGRVRRWGSRLILLQQPWSPARTVNKSKCWIALKISSDARSDILSSHIQQYKVSVKFIILRCSNLISFSQNQIRSHGLWWQTWKTRPGQPRPSGQRKLLPVKGMLHLTFDQGLYNQISWALSRFNHTRVLF